MDPEHLLEVLHKGRIEQSETLSWWVCSCWVLFSQAHHFLSLYDEIELSVFEENYS